MANLVTAEKVSLKNHPEIKEDAIQKFIFDNPMVLGLGDLVARRREVTQPAGGRLDILLADDETRYEVEIQLGATDPSHIIRTIEYWDNERKRFPQYDHCAVIVAEEITGRFMNVISLFNGTIPIIALQMQAVKVGEDIQLSFIKVLDRVYLGDDETDTSEPTDRNYWEKKCKALKYVDEVFKEVVARAPGFNLKYNKYYIGMEKEGAVTNFVWFRPKKQFIYLYIKCDEGMSQSEMLDNSELEYKYSSRDKAYRIAINKIEDFKNNKDLIGVLIDDAIKLRNVDA